MKVSVICITAREKPGLGRLLDSLREQSFDRDEFELVYGDRLWKERGDSVHAYLDDSGINYQYIRDEPTQLGPCPAGARNACIAAAGGEWIISIDDLTFLEPETIEKHYDLCESGFDAIAGSYLSSIDGGEYQNEDGRVTNEGGIVSPTDHTVWMCWWGLHTGFSKAAWEKVNGYDETFDGVYGMEDIDFGHRLKMAGCSMAWQPDILVRCERGSSHSDTHAQLIPDNAPTSWARGDLKWRNDKLIDYCRALNIVRGARIE